SGRAAGGADRMIVWVVTGRLRYLKFYRSLIVTERPSQSYSLRGTAAGQAAAGGMRGMGGSPDSGRSAASRGPADAGRRSRPAHALTAGAGLIVCVILALAVLHGFTQYRDAVAQARRNAENLTLTLADQTRHAVAAVDQLLAGVGEVLRLVDAAGT